MINIKKMLFYSAVNLLQKVVHMLSILLFLLGTPLNNLFDLSAKNRTIGMSNMLYTCYFDADIVIPTLDRVSLALISDSCVM